MSDKHDFCRARLKMARFNARLNYIKLPAIKSSLMHFETYAIFADPDFYREYNSCCAFDARADAVYELIDLLKVWHNLDAYFKNENNLDNVV